MKKAIVILLTLLTQLNAFAQIDKHGNPIFNNEPISEEKFDDFELTCCYYNIKDNISNKQSSVYVSDNPTLPDYLKFSRNLPSYFFIVHKGPNVIMMFILLQKNDGEKTILTYNINNPNNGKSIDVPCSVFGEISEKRVEELEALNVDTTARIVTVPAGKAYQFEGIVYLIQPYDKLKEEVIEIARQLINGGNKEEIKDPVAYIKKETIGGKLDFNLLLEKETQGLFIYDGVAYNKKDLAIYLWGKSVKNLGISSSKKAAALWEEINKRPLTDPEKKALTSGFNNKSK